MRHSRIKTSTRSSGRRNIHSNPNINPLSRRVKPLRNELRPHQCSQRPVYYPRCCIGLQDYCPSRTSHRCRGYERHATLRLGRRRWRADYIYLACWSRGGLTCCSRSSSNDPGLGPSYRSRHDRVVAFCASPSPRVKTHVFYCPENGVQRACYPCDIACQGGTRVFIRHPGSLKQAF